jgi:uncharacterized membrane protein YeaQ/YmgE (transglycosylase-associated protein family)
MPLLYLSLFSRLTLVAGSLTLDPGGCVSWVIVGLFAGWLAGHVARGRGFGCLGDLLLGLVGAAVGAFVLNLVDVGLSGVQGFFGSLTVAFLGAFALALIGRLIGGNRGREIRVRFDYPPRRNRTPDRQP